MNFNTHKLTHGPALEDETFAKLSIKTKLCLNQLYSNKMGIYNKPVRETLFPYIIFYFSRKIRSLAT